MPQSGGLARARATQLWTDRSGFPAELARRARAAELSDAEVRALRSFAERGVFEIAGAIDHELLASQLATLPLRSFSGSTGEGIEPNPAVASLALHPLILGFVRLAFDAKPSLERAELHAGAHRERAAARSTGTADSGPRLRVWLACSDPAPNDRLTTRDAARVPPEVREHVLERGDALIAHPSTRVDQMGHQHFLVCAYRAPAQSWKSAAVNLAKRSSHQAGAFPNNVPRSQ